MNQISWFVVNVSIPLATESLRPESCRTVADKSSLTERKVLKEFLLYLSIPCPISNSFPRHSYLPRSRAFLRIRCLAPVRRFTASWAILAIAQLVNLQRRSFLFLLKSYSSCIHEEELFCLFDDVVSVNTCFSIHSSREWKGTRTRKRPTNSGTKKPIASSLIRKRRYWCVQNK